MLFDKFEYLSCLLYADITRHEWVPVGCFGWRSGFLADPKEIRLVDDEVDAEGDSWGPIKARLFSTVDEFGVLKFNVDKKIQEISAQLRC